MNLTILGAGTLSGFIIDIIRRIKTIEIDGQYDDRYPQIKSSNGLPIIGRLNDVPKNCSLALGIGEPNTRKQLFDRLSLHGCNFPTIIDPSCIISEKARVGEGVIIGPLSSVLSGAEINTGACLLSHVNVNQNVRIGAFALVGAGVVIGNEAHIGAGSHLGMGLVVQPGERIEDGIYVRRQ